MLLEFRSTRPPGPPPLSDGRRQRAYWPGGVLLAAGALLFVPDTGVARIPGQIAALAGGVLLGNAVVARRRASTRREPRRWTITDDDLRAGNSLGSVRWTWIQVRRVVEHPDAYLLYQSDSPHTATFDVPRDTLTPAQDTEFRDFLRGRGLIES